MNSMSKRFNGDRLVPTRDLLRILIVDTRPNGYIHSLLSSWRREQSPFQQHAICASLDLLRAWADLVSISCSAKGTESLFIELVKSLCRDDTCSPGIEQNHLSWCATVSIVSLK